LLEGNTRNHCNHGVNIPVSQLQYSGRRDSSRRQRAGRYDFPRRYCDSSFAPPQYVSLASCRQCHRGFHDANASGCEYPVLPESRFVNTLARPVSSSLTVQYASVPGSVMTRPTCGAPADSRETDETPSMAWLHGRGVATLRPLVAQRPTTGPRRPPLACSSLWMGRNSKPTAGGRERQVNAV
jgi:hypothetical protein